MGKELEDYFKFARSKENLELSRNNLLGQIVQHLKSIYGKDSITMDLSGSDGVFKICGTDETKLAIIEDLKSAGII